MQGVVGGGQGVLSRQLGTLGLQYLLEVGESGLVKLARKVGGIARRLRGGTPGITVPACREATSRSTSPVTTLRPLGLAISTTIATR